MSTKQFVIAGTGLPELIDLAEDVCNDDPTYKFLGFIDDNKENKNRNLYGYEILGGFDFLSKYHDVSVVNGIARNSKVRQDSTTRLSSFSTNFINLIHPTVFRRGEISGTGNIIDRYCILNRGSKISSHNLILTNVVVGHDVLIGNLNFLGHNVIVNGHAKIKDSCFLAARSLVAPNICIAENVTLGLGVVVTDSVNSGVTLLNRPPLMHRY